MSKVVWLIFNMREKGSAVVKGTVVTQTEGSRVEAPLRPGALVRSRLGLPWIDLACGCFTYMLALINDGKFEQIKLIFMFCLGLPPLRGPKCFIGGVILLPRVLAVTYLVSFPVPVKKCWTTL